MTKAEVYNRIGALLHHQDPDALTGWRRRGLLALRLVVAVANHVANGLLTLRAMSLAYTTLLSLVPLLAVSFSVLKAFGVHNQLRPALAQLLAPLGPRATEITDKVVEFVENIQVGVLGALGLVLLLYTVIALMQKIEEAFNATWHIQRPRPIARRFSDYLSVLLIGPVLVFSALGITASLFRADWVQRLAAIQPLGMVVDSLAALVPYLLIIAAFTFVYVFMPNTRVRPMAALSGALVAGFLWQSMGWLFAAFLAGSTRYTAVYSAFATLILFMIWLYLSWVIVLMGACIAYYVQHPAQLREHQEAVRLSPSLQEHLALAVLVLVAEAYYRREPAPDGDHLADALHTPASALDVVLDALHGAGLLDTQHEPGESPTYRPGTPPETTFVREVLAAVRHHGEVPGLRAEALAEPAAVANMAVQWESAAAASVADHTVRDLVRVAAQEGLDDSP